MAAIGCGRGWRSDMCGEDVRSARVKKWGTVKFDLDSAESSPGPLEARGVSPSRRPGVLITMKIQAAGLAMLDAIAHAAQVEPLTRPAAEPAGDRTTAGDRDTAGRVSLAFRLCYGLFVVVGLAMAVAFGVFWFSPERLPRDFGRQADVADIVLFWRPPLCCLASPAARRLRLAHVPPGRFLPPGTRPAARPAGRADLHIRPGERVARHAPQHPGRDDRGRLPARHLGAR